MNNALPPKVFLADDPVKRLDLLKSQDVEYTVAGGEVDSCYVLGLIDSDGNFADLDHVSRVKV